MSETPAINETLIRQYADRYRSGDETAFRDLTSIFDFQRRQMQRAEELCRVAWQEVTRREKAASSPGLTSASEPLPGLGRVQPRPPKKAASSGGKTVAQAVRESPPGVEVDMDDL